MTGIPSTHKPTVGFVGFIRPMAKYRAKLEQHDRSYGSQSRVTIGARKALLEGGCRTV